MLEIKAKDKAKVVQIIKKTLTIVKSVPPKMSQGYWNHLWYFVVVVNIILVFLFLIMKKMKEEVETVLYQTKRSSMYCGLVLR